MLSARPSTPPAVPALPATSDMRYLLPTVFSPRLWLTTPSLPISSAPSGAAAHAYNARKKLTLSMESAQTPTLSARPTIPRTETAWPATTAISSRAAAAKLINLSQPMACAPSGTEPSVLSATLSPTSPMENATRSTLSAGPLTARTVPAQPATRDTSSATAPATWIRALRLTPCASSGAVLSASNAQLLPTLWAASVRHPTHSARPLTAITETACLAMADTCSSMATVTSRSAKLLQVQALTSTFTARNTGVELAQRVSSVSSSRTVDALLPSTKPTALPHDAVSRSIILLHCLHLKTYLASKIIHRIDRI